MNQNDILTGRFYLLRNQEVVRVESQVLGDPDSLQVYFQDSAGPEYVQPSDFVREVDEPTEDDH